MNHGTENGYNRGCRCDACRTAKREGRRRRRDQQPTRPRVPLEKRFYEKTRQVGECLIWTSQLNGRGRPYFWFKGTNALAHRVAWELENGPIPGGAEIHHTCFNTQCVNPAHLELMPSYLDHWEITRETGETISAVNARKTHCIHGHPLSGDNLIELVANSPTRKGPMRKCRTCEIARHKRRDAKKKAARHAAKAARV